MPMLVFNRMHWWYWGLQVAIANYRILGHMINFSFPFTGLGRLLLQICSESHDTVQSDAFAQLDDSLAKQFIQKAAKQCMIMS